ncbi:uncharacterized protein LOC144710683 isoform X2 [Wolffia australiana]
MAWECASPSKAARLSGGSEGIVLGPGRGGRSGFTFMQLQELEDQILIFQHLACRVPVPFHLVLPIWKSVAGSSPLLHTLSFPYGFLQLRRRRGDGFGARPLPENRRQEVALRQTRRPKSEILRTPHAPWPPPLEKALRKPRRELFFSGAEDERRLSSFHARIFPCQRSFR